MSKLVIMIGGVVGLVAIGAAVYFFVLGGGGSAEAHAEPEAVHVPGKLGPHLVFKERVFNLATAKGGEKHFLKMGYTVEFETTDPAYYKLTGEALTKALEEFAAEIGGGRALIEDAITMVVSAKTAEQIATTEGKEKLKEELIEAIHERLEEPPVYRILLTSFITD